MQYLFMGMSAGMLQRFMLPLCEFANESKFERSVFLHLTMIAFAILSRCSLFTPG